MLKEIAVQPPINFHPSVFDTKTNTQFVVTSLKSTPAQRQTREVRQSKINSKVCVFLGRPVNDKEYGVPCGLRLRNCSEHGTCTILPSDKSEYNCLECKDKVIYDPSVQPTETARS